MTEKLSIVGDPDLWEDFGHLQESDHFYYMCTKFFSDGEVHKYFNPYDTPYEAFINYMNVLEARRPGRQGDRRPRSGGRSREEETRCPETRCQEEIDGQTYSQSGLPVRGQLGGL